MHYYCGPSLITPKATFGPRGVDYTLGVDYEACHENTAVSHYESLKVCIFFYLLFYFISYSFTSLFETIACLYTKAFLFFAMITVPFISVLLCSKDCLVYFI